MAFETCIRNNRTILMEGALGERLKREYGLTIDGPVAMASLVYTEEGRRALSLLWQEYMEIAKRYGLPFMATTPTRRANRERVLGFGYSEDIIADNVRFLKSIREASGLEMYVGGLVGCKGDAYTGEGALSEEDAEQFHAWTAAQFKKAGVDFLYAGIMPTLPEAAGLAKAVSTQEIPYIISFTIQQDGTLIDGTTIADAIEYIDAGTKHPPVCYMANCVHPNILAKALLQPFNDIESVKRRFRGLQANTSPLSYAELDGAADLKCSEPEAFSQEMLKLKEIGEFQIWGGCCGTDNRHMAAIAEKLTGSFGN